MNKNSKQGCYSAATEQWEYFGRFLLIPKPSRAAVNPTAGSPDLVGQTPLSPGLWDWLVVFKENVSGLNCELSFVPASPNISAPHSNRKNWSKRGNSPW